MRIHVQQRALERCQVCRRQGGSESMKKIPAHKFLLAISSPVFFAMFYGELAETRESIEISDCEHESLLELFRFIYSDEVNLNPDNVMQVLYLAKKYLLPALADKCTEYLGKNLDASNVFHVLPDAQKFEEKVLVENCWEMIDQHADEAVKSEGFVTIERSVLEELVERDSLNVKEVELFKAVDCWATKECEKQGLEADGSVKRMILGERIVKGIRFPVMEEKEFADVVLDCDILTKTESFNMMKYFNNVLKIPVGFCEAERAGQLKRMYRFGTEDKLLPWRYASSGSSNSIILAVDKNVKLHAVCLFGSENNEYSVDLKVIDNNDHVLAAKAGKFVSKLMQGEGGDYQGFYIQFEPPVSLREHTKYCLEALISGPPSSYGHQCLFHLTHSGVTFSFVDKAGTKELRNTTVSSGQFSEFVFTR